MKLTTQQLHFLETFGYLHLPGIMQDSIDRIIQEFEAVFAGRGGGHYGQQHDGQQRSCIVPFIDQSEYLSGLLDDPRIDGVISSILGDDYLYTGSDGNYYVGDTNWHSDGGYSASKRGIKHYKLAFYLDPLTRDTGALRVIPGSHKFDDAFAEGLESAGMGDPARLQALWGINGDQVPAIALETNPGDIAIFNHATKHSSWGGNQQRRMFTINCAQHHSDDQLPQLRDEISGAARFWIDSVYGDTMLRTAGPQRMRHLEQILANQGHLPEEVRKAKLRMKEPARG